MARNHEVSMRLCMPLLATAIGACQSQPHTPAAPPSSVAHVNAPALDSTDWGAVDISGYYILQDPIPAWAAHIEELTLTTVDLQLTPGDSTPEGLRKLATDTQALASVKFRPALLHGFIRVKDDSSGHAVDFHLLSLLVIGRRRAFATAAVGTVSYEF